MGPRAGCATPSPWPPDMPEPADWLLTVRRHPCLSLDHLHDVAEPGDDRWIVYRVVDALTDSYFPVMHEIDGRIDHLEEEILDGDAKDALRALATSVVPARAEMAMAPMLIQ